MSSRSKRRRRAASVCTSSGLTEQQLIDATEKKMIGPTTEWAVDPVNGNDENSGEPGYPLKTMAEFARRNQGRAAYAPDGPVTINVLSDLKVEIE